MNIEKLIELIEPRQLFDKYPNNFVKCQLEDSSGNHLPNDIDYNYEYLEYCEKLIDVFSSTLTERDLRNSEISMNFCDELDDSVLLCKELYMYYDILVNPMVAYWLWTAYCSFMDANWMGGISAKRIIQYLEIIYKNRHD